MLGGEEDDVGLLASMGIPQQQWEAVRGESVLNIWPENWPSLEVFASMQTQWRIGMNGPTGLDYAALPVVMDLVEVETSLRPECFSGMQEMEREALSIFGRKNGRQ